jgi:arginyl-tRNA synthetase
MASANAKEKERSKTQEPTVNKQNTKTFEKVEIPDNIEGLSVKEIKNLLDKLGVKRDDCFEKEDLINRL